MSRARAMRYQDRDEAAGCLKWVVIVVAVLFIVGWLLDWA